MQMLLLMGLLACLIVVPALFALLITESDEWVWWLVGGPVALLLVWTIGKLAFAPFLLVLCDQGSFNALRQSLTSVGNHLWLALIFILSPGLLAFCLMFTFEMINLSPSNPFWEWLMRSGVSYVQLASAVLVYYLYLAVAEKSRKHVMTGDP